MLLPLRLSDRLHYSGSPEYYPTRLRLQQPASGADVGPSLRRGRLHNGPGVEGGNRQIAVRIGICLLAPARKPCVSCDRPFIQAGVCRRS